MPNPCWIECIHEWFPTFAKIIKPMFEYRDGATWLDASRPGMGVELDQEAAAKYRVDPGADEAVRDKLGVAETATRYRTLIAEVISPITAQSSMDLGGCQPPKLEMSPESNLRL